ncbi:MAG TPA: hypothetical protein VMR21_03685 [Vicinamibacteria bacterium]|nr:hypothetical protein [Vicinamibacteria bacterium]
MLVTLATVVIGLIVGIALAWLVLSGVLALAFRRARTLLRRIAERRRAQRPGESDRRHAERRAQ